ncbi:hypothetical protein [Haladaptatus cibarius]|uniref:hypothetical protein n=1 Tax=Haladaptatus cibarius TaxID=453847 RepID=UPI000679E7D4|nr:hypothetical protein [Haladaptatus cibarius]
MSHDNTDGSETSRRTLLKAIGAGAVAGAGIAASSATGAADPSNCYTEYDCSGAEYQYRDAYQRYSRQCCDYGDGTYQCGSWEEDGCC